jgi:hypothetical protein
MMHRFDSQIILFDPQNEFLRRYGGSVAELNPKDAFDSRRPRVSLQTA